MIVNSDQTSFLFGKLTWESIPLHEPILVATFAAVALGGIAVVGALTYFRLWGYLWNEWFTSIDHKSAFFTHGPCDIVCFNRLE